MGFFEKKKSVTLYHPGCLCKEKLPHVVKATEEVLKDLGVTYSKLPLTCCGYPAWYAGYEEEFVKIQEENKQLFARENVTKIITNDPHCALTFKEKYGIPTEHIIQVVEEQSHKLNVEVEKRANYHHPCFLDKVGVDAKRSLGVLRKAGVHIPIENKSSGCCGSIGGDFCRNNLAEAARVAEERMKDFKEPLLVTACPHCQLSFKDRKVKDIVEVFR